MSGSGVANVGSDEGDLVVGARLGAIELALFGAALVGAVLGAAEGAL
jgi:hypothetical protein